MTLNEVHEGIARIGCLSMTTLDGDTMHSRIISVCGGDECGSCVRTCPQGAIELPLTL
ncbi:4Fe-4S binding protein [uncultured Pseudodesulfovibrio sp.]|uniref:4Fe-4S binding protein n=1 Tax=uncultured Pseudodesulfovibrio sp. TaxID=2035858 RepID=UPI0029C7BCC0|nr:4Fe-4S binding protein [uncultured Pseudodesulfovibrio sp.]